MQRKYSGPKEGREKSIQARNSIRPFVPTIKTTTKLVWSTDVRHPIAMGITTSLTPRKSQFRIFNLLAYLQQRCTIAKQLEVQNNISSTHNRRMFVSSWIGADVESILMIVEGSVPPRSVCAHMVISVPSATGFK